MADVPARSPAQQPLDALQVAIASPSSLLATTMPPRREVIEDLTAAGVRDRFKVIVGGRPC